jgi:tyrosinase
MRQLSRRSFMAGSAAIPFSVWLERDAAAQGYASPQKPLVRYDARSPQGQAMLKTYAQAVGKMMKSTPEGDPRGWVFQWYTHWVKGKLDPVGKTTELKRIYPAPSPWRSLAEAMWDTCQAHGPNEDENFFLPWHRMFVFFFERIIRYESQNNAFTLPYWNYSTSDKTIRGVIPPQFREKNDPVFGPLYIENRNPGVNQGQPIQKGQPDDPLSLSALAECRYGTQGNDPGFCQGLDFGLHGNVHVLVGDTMNMGQVPWAARDPIFWMHHCNIDRLWASWNAAGRSNPSDSSFLAQTFTFADTNGKQVVATVKDFLDIAKLGYSYDHLEPVPKCPTPGPVALAAAQGTRRHATVRATPIALGADPVRVNLDPLAAAAQEKAAGPLTARVKALPEGRRLYLLVRDLRTDEQPGVLYHVYLELPEKAAPEQSEAHHVGVLNFFHAHPAGNGGHAHGDAAGSKSDRFYRFDITDLAKTLQSKGSLSERPTVTIAPAGRPAAEAKPLVGEITLIEE